MNTGSRERVLRASLGLSLVIALGCDITPYPTTPSSTTPTSTPAPGPTPPRSAQELAALALFDAAAVHEAATTAAITWATEGGKVSTDGPCPGGIGSLQASLDGGSSPAQGTFLPTGSHTYVVSFSNCLMHHLAGWELHGVASAAYNAAEWSNVTATVSADAVRVQTMNFLSDLYDVTAGGSAVWTRMGTSTTTTTYTPASGSRLVNNRTTGVATFGGGSYSMIRYPGNRWDRRFDNLKVAVNGTEYTLNGNHEETGGGPGVSHTGEVRIINDGTLVARIYGDGGSRVRVEVLVPLIPL